MQSVWCGAKRNSCSAAHNIVRKRNIARTYYRRSRILFPIHTLAVAITIVFRRTCERQKPKISKISGIFRRFLYNTTCKITHLKYRQAEGLVGNGGPKKEDQKAMVGKMQDWRSRTSWRRWKMKDRKCRTAGDKFHFQRSLAKMSNGLHTEPEC